MSRLIRPILLLLLLIPGASHAQSRYHFSTLDMDQGLSANYVWSISQDKYGFMWFGTTNGISRYDGHKIRKYVHDDRDSFSLPGNTIYWIHRDGSGDMWLACGINGLVRYNYAKDRFEKFEGYERMKKQTGLPAPVWRVGEDQQHRIYIACGGACFRYTPSTGQMENLTPLFKGKIDGYGVAMFVPQGPDILWILTDNSLFKHVLSKNTIEYIEYDRERFGYGSAAFIDGEMIDEEEMILTTARSGFVFFNTKTKTFRPAPAPFNPEISKIYSTSGGVIKDSKGRFWIVNSVFGLVEYIKHNKTYTVKSDPSYPYPHPEQEGQGTILYEDRDGNIWYGTSQSGVIWFQPKLDFVSVYRRDYADTNSLAEDRTASFYPASNGEMYIGTAKGLTRMNVEKNRYQNFPRSVGSTGNYPGGFTTDLAKSGDTLVIASNSGLVFYDEKRRVFHRYTDEDPSKPYPLFNYWVATVMPLQPGWLLLISGTGEAARFDMNTGNCYSAQRPDYNDTLYSFTGIHCVLHDTARRKIWLEAKSGELYEYDPNLRSVKRHRYTGDSTTKYISAIDLDKFGRLWMATSSGLVLYDPATSKSQRWNMPTATQALLNLSCTAGDLVWTTTANELVQFNTATGKGISFNLHVLMPHASLYARSLMVDKEGFVWLGSNKGFCRVDGGRFNWQTKNADPQLVDFRVFDQPKLFGQPFNELKEIVLNYNENFFSFDFSSLDFSQAAGIRYAYRLHPFDAEWRLSDKNVASYTNVPPGTYRLMLRSEYGLGQWREAKPITVRIGFPWWQQPWFIALVIAATVAIGWFLYRLWMRKKAQERIDQTIDYFANSLYGENSVNEICWDIARNCIAQMKLEDCVVYLLDEKRGVLVQKAAFGPKNPKDHEIINPIEIPVGKGIVGVAAETGKYILVKDTSKDSRYIVDVGQRCSELAVPIVHEGIVIGVIDSEHSRRNFFTDAHIKLLSTIAAISANKIAEARADAAARESKMQLLEIKKLLAESQLMALRAQMNPHFVFNCLNSIQECIVTQKYGEASLYLNKFAKLFRSVLNNSGKGMVTLAEETEVLELYLALEHMRFEKSFSYTIHMDEELESDEMLIPSMLLQPYVENALWHGLMHKQGERKLCISFTRKSNAVFECIIEDNGIGRKKAMELKEQQNKSKKHTSRGMAISKDRLDLLQKQGQHAVLEIIDKYDDGGAATGTKVVIELSSFLQ